MVQYAPFSSVGRISSPCIPDLKAFPSHKFFLRKRLTMNVIADTAGNKFAAVVFNPYTIDNAGTYNCACYTNGTTPSPDNLTLRDTSATGTDGWQVAHWDSPYDATFGAANEFRVVGAGIRVSYSGVWDQCEGQVAVYANPTNTGITSGTTTFDDLLKYDETAYVPLENGKTYECVYHPRRQADYNYINSGDQEAFSMVIAIDSPPDAANASFIVDLIGWYEGVGPDFNGLTPSHADVVALGKINSMNKAQSGGFFGNPNPLSP